MLFPSSVLMKIFIKLVKNKGNSGYYHVIKDLVLQGLLCKVQTVNV